jgi:hypothetical protein
MGRLGQLPPWKDEHAGVDLQRQRQHLRALDTETDPIIFNGGNGRLRNWPVLT